MKFNMFLFKMLFIFLVLNPTNQFAQSKKNDSPCDIEEQSICNKIGNQKYKEGYGKGEKEGYEKGKKEGYGKGKKEGILIGKEQVREDFENISPERIEDFKVIYEVQKFNSKGEKSFYEQRKILENDAIERYLSSQEIRDVLDAEFLRGYSVGFRERHAIALRKGQKIKLLSNKGDIDNLMIDYSSITKSIVRVKEGGVGYQYFQESVKKVHVNILEYLSNRLGLSPEEHNDLFIRYDEIHEKLTELYLENYLFLLKYRNIKNNSSTSIYHYEYHISTSAFLEVIKSGICSVADITFTYAKSNGHFAATSGLEATGHICELILKELMVQIDYKFRQQSLSYDYAVSTQYVTSHTRNIATDLVVGYELDSLEKDTTVKINEKLEANIKIMIYTKYSTAVDTKEYYCEVDNANQIFRFYANPKPKVVEITSQYYKVVEIEMKMDYDKEVVKYSNFVKPDSSPKTKTVKATEKYKLKGDIIEELFDNNKPRIYTIKPPDLTMFQLDKIIAISLKSIEPAITLSNSCYNVDFWLGGERKKLIKTNCY